MGRLAEAGLPSRTADYIGGVGPRQRGGLPVLQGTILVLAMFFVILNVAVDVLQTALDPRVERS